MQKNNNNFYDLFLDVTVTSSNIYILNITILFYPIILILQKNNRALGCVVKMVI